MATLTPAQVAPLFPGAKVADIKANLPLVLAALAKEGLGDPDMVAMAIATIRVETAGFVPIDEYRSKYNTKNAPFDLYEPGTSVGKKLGNTDAGDGAKFKGRGFVQLTGRYNYATIGKRLNLPLLSEPTLANDPTIAARILASFLKRDETAIRAALARGDLAKARKLVNGGSHGLGVFRRTYQALRALPPPVTDMPKREPTPVDQAKAPGAAAVASGAGAGALEQAQAELAQAHGWVAGVAEFLDYAKWALIGLALVLAGLAIWRAVKR